MRSPALVAVLSPIIGSSSIDESRVVKYDGVDPWPQPTIIRRVEERCSVWFANRTGLPRSPRWSLLAAAGMPNADTGATTKTSAANTARPLATTD